MTFQIFFINHKSLKNNLSTLWGMGKIYVQLTVQSQPNPTFEWTYLIGSVYFNGKLFYGEGIPSF